ncbi:YdeI/OmpD-associated family protein [Penaeicola halotolerans]|uniref:YdeI/OmpD-associated family protein n=1 Tax=Penaeicola halotolerans TaxID=2793196 RepID=UPI001CF91516|nr:YdeI/OmpD-associated family protein [Penaeicola halotolerans]
MEAYHGKQVISQKGGYYILKVAAEAVARFAKGAKTRFICSIDDVLTLSCGLNHFGDGDFYIMISAKYLSRLGKNVGDEVMYTLAEHPNPLGVDMPEVLEAVLAQDEVLHARFESMTDGRKRSIIFAVSKLKDIDKQISRARELILYYERHRGKRD